MKRVFLSVAVSLLAVNFTTVLAQERPMGPPPVLLIVREDFKPGMMPAHARHSAAFARIFAKLKTPNYRIALWPVAGSENDLLYVTAAGSFAEIEKIQQDTDKKMAAVGGATRAELDRLEKEAPDLHAGMRDMLAIYRPELSFNPDVNIAQMRYFAITTVRVRPGHDAEYADYIRAVVNVAREKAKVDNFHLACYQVISGAPGGTYMFFRAMKSLGEFDQNLFAKVRAAMSDDMRKTADKTNADAVIISESSTYAYEPRMSYVEKDLAAQDPTFWNPKPEPTMPKRPVKKKTAKAPAPTTNPQ